MSLLNPDTPLSRYANFWYFAWTPSARSLLVYFNKKVNLITDDRKPGYLPLCRTWSGSSLLRSQTHEQWWWWLKTNVEQHWFDLINANVAHLHNTCQLCALQLPENKGHPAQPPLDRCEYSPPTLKSVCTQVLLHICQVCCHKSLAGHWWHVLNES